METVIPSRLKNINAARLHGWPRPVTIGAAISCSFSALLTHITWTGEENERFIVAILEHIPFQINQHLKQFLSLFPPFRR